MEYAGEVLVMAVTAVVVALAVYEAAKRPGGAAAAVAMVTAIAGLVSALATLVAALGR